MGGAANPGANRLNQPGMAAPMGQPAPNVYQQSAGAYTNALAGTQGAMGYQPQQVSAGYGYDPGNVSAQQIGTQFGYNPGSVSAGTAVGGIGSYMNPYSDQVINASMADLERQRQTQMNALGAQATAAGAFGGSRQGVAEALTNEGFAQQGGQLAGQLRQQGFQTALGASQQDVANAMQAALANQQAGGRAAEFGQSTRLQAQGMNQQAGLQAALANQAARAQAAQFGQQNSLQAQIANQQAGLQGAQQSLAGAGQLGNLSNLGFGFGQQIGAQQAAEGQRMQAMNQALIDAAKGQFGGFTGAPQNALSTFLASLGGAQTGQQTQTTTERPGIFDYFTAGASAICWVAREVYGEDDPRWTQFREWLLNDAPQWLLKLYVRHGEWFAGIVRKVPVLKRALRPLMDRARRAAGFVG